jgi:hypothetical protein
MWIRQNLAGLSIVRQASMLARQTATRMPDRKPDDAEREMLGHERIIRMAIEESHVCEIASLLRFSQ